MPEIGPHEIELVQNAETEAVLRSDIETLDGLWPDDLIVSSNENLILSKPQLFALFQAGLVQLETLVREISKAVTKENAAFVTGHQKTVSRIGPNAGMVLHSSYMDSWIREKGVWRLIARHSAAMLRVPRADQSKR